MPDWLSVDSVAGTILINYSSQTMLGLNEAILTIGYLNEPGNAGIEFDIELNVECPD